MQAVVNDSLNEDGTVRRKEPMVIQSRRTSPALDAPKRTAKKSTAKKTAAKRK